jgi:AcrR family transcriptional regulator
MSMPRKADKRLEGRIIDAAYQLWRKGGEHTLTMRAVARAAGTTTPTLYERFQDKHDLIEFLRERARQRIFKAVQPGKTTLEVCRLGLQFTLAHGNEYLLFSADWGERLGRNVPMPSFDLLKEKLAQDLGGNPEEHAQLALALILQLHGTGMVLQTKGVKREVSERLQELCLDTCKALIDSARGGQAR